MRKTIAARLGYISLFCFFLALGRLSGGEAAHPYPVKAYASVASLPEFIEAVDRFTVLATADTTRNIKPGVLAAILRAHLVMPVAGWNEDKEMYILFLANRPAPLNMVVVVHADSLDAFAEGMADGNVTVTKDPDGFAGRPSVSLATTGSGKLVAVDIGDAKIAISPSADCIAIALDHLESGAWSMTHPADADLSVVFPMPGFDSPVNPMLQTVTELQRNRYGMLAELEGMKINPRIGEAFLSFFEKRIAALGEEMTAVRAMAVDCRFTDDTLGLGVRVVSRPDSFLGRMGERLATLDNVDDSLLLHSLEKGSAWAAVAGAAPARIIPDFNARLEGLAAEFAEKAAPGGENAESSREPEALSAIGGDDWAVAGDWREGGLRGTVYSTARTADFIASLDALARGVNAFVERTLTEPSLALEIVAADGAGEGREYRLSFREPAHIDTLFQMLRMSNPAFALTRESLESRRVVAGGDDGRGFAVIDAGEAGDAEKAADAGVLTPSSAARVAAMLPHRQGGFALADMDKLLDAVFMEMLRELVVGMDTAHAALHIENMMKALPTMRKSDGLIGFGFGSNGGDSVIEAVVPYKSIGAALANYEIFIEAAAHDGH